MHGVIQIHHSADWLSSDGEDDAEDEQQQQQQEEQQEEDERQLQSATQQAPALQTNALESSCSASSAGTRTTAARPRASLPASQRRQVRQPGRPVGKKRAMSYAEKYALQTGITTDTNARAQQQRDAARTEQNATAANRPEDTEGYACSSSPSPSASYADILIIAPSSPLPSADAAAAAALPACEDEAALALRYPDFFDSLSIADKASASSSSAEAAAEAAALVPSASPPAYRAYTLSDWRSLPRDVRLGSLGASLDPAALEARRRKQREMRQLEQEVREQNARRRQREQEKEKERERERETRQRAEHSDEKAEAEAERKTAAAAEITNSSRDRAKAFASRVPKPQPAAAKVSARERGGKKAAEAETEQGEVLRSIVEREERKEERKEQLKLSKEAVSSSRRARAQPVEVKRGGSSSQPNSDALLQLVAEQEKERRKVQQIRQSLGLK